MIKRNANFVLRDLATRASPLYFLQGAGTFLIMRNLRANRAYIQGRILDVGAGYGGFRSILQPWGSYEGFDIAKFGPHITHVGHAEKMDLIKSGSIDTVVCLQTLQYTENPFLVGQEITRVLKSGGHVIISVPHISYLNNPPYDRWRFTPEGLRAVLGDGVATISIHKLGGMASLFGWILSTVILGVTGRFPILRDIGLVLNGAIQLVVLGVDWVIPTRLILPLFVFGVFEKR